MPPGTKTSLRFDTFGDDELDEAFKIVDDEGNKSPNQAEELIKKFLSL